MRAGLIVIISLLVILVTVYADTFVFAGISQTEDTGYSALYLNQQSNPKWVSFSIANKEGVYQTYIYEIYEQKVTQERLACAGVVTVPEKSTSVTYYPLGSERIGRVRVMLPATGQEVSYYTGYEFQEWRPEIVQGLPWEKQDPIVRHYYKYVQEVSKDYNYRR